MKSKQFRLRDLERRDVEIVLMKKTVVFFKSEELYAKQDNTREIYIELIIFCGLI